jgi:hypothetical protein
MSNPLDRRLIALERGPGASRVVYRIYSSTAEADADNEPQPSETTVIAIITGVSRAARRPDSE